MMRFAVGFIVFFGTCSGLLAAGPRNVIAHSSGDWTWCARVDAATPTDLSAAPAENEQTTIFAREDGPGQKWQALPKLSGRAIALAGRSSQLAVLMSSGDWLTVWADGSATGQPLPAEGRLVTLADDGKDLWAVGSVKGGIAAAKADLMRQRAATQPTTSELRDQTTNPETEPSRIARAIRSKLVVFREENGRWVAVAELPADSIAASKAEISNLAGSMPEVTGEDISLAIVDGVPTIAIKGVNNTMKVISYGPGNSWIGVQSSPLSAAHTIEAFAVLTDSFKTALWATTGTEAGILFPDAAHSFTEVPLRWVSKDSFDGTPAATFSGGYLCLFGPHAGNILEQRYKITGQPVETAEPIALPSEHEMILPVWLQAALLASVGFLVGANMHRQWLNQSPQEEVAEISPPAPLWLRFAAGMVDLIPVIAVIAYLLTQFDSSRESMEIPKVRSLIFFFSALGVYILHTTLMETFTGRSIGKWLFGLKVVTTSGGLPSRSQFLIRNLLRIVDPLVMIIVSPLRQRSADSVAGTFVVRVVEKPDTGDADKTGSA